MNTIKKFIYSYGIKPLTKTEVTFAPNPKPF